MNMPNLLLLYVEDPSKSALFYEDLFELKPVANFPTYVAFAFENGFNIGLWSIHAKNFVSKGEGSKMELAFMVESEFKVREFYEKCEKMNVKIEQGLHHAVFGLTFVALDPDGHRIRVCIPDK